MDFKNKIILAPMVRLGFLPLRLLSLEYGADIVYSEEIIDHKILQCERIINPVLNTVDYIIPGEKYPIFQTCAAERDKIVFQLGTCDPERALKVVALVQNDVAAIDVNMGCPKPFSIQGGMGAALLKQPEKVQKILTTLVQNCSKPVTCKIRVLPDLEKTIELVKLIESCGVSALAVHGRTKEERRRHPNRNHVIRQIAESLSIPVIANGGSSEVKCFEDIERFRTETGASSVMLARAAMLNPSIFRRNGLLPIDAVIKAYLKHACDYESYPAMVKYTMQVFLQDAISNTERGRNLLESTTFREYCRLWDMEEYCMKQSAKRRDRMMRANFSTFGNCVEKIDSDAELFENSISLEMPFVRRRYDRILPKNILIDYCKANKLPAPTFKTVSVEKSFLCVVEIEGKRFHSTIIEKNIRSAEQSAALVAVVAMNLEDKLPSACLDDIPADEIEEKFGKRVNVRKVLEICT